MKKKRYHFIDFTRKDIMARHFHNIIFKASYVFY